MTDEQLLKDYEEYYSYMEEKYTRMGYERYAGVFRKILDVLHESENFDEFIRKFSEYNFTVEIGKAKVIDEARIRKKAYSDSSVYVKHPYWVKDESYVRYEAYEKMADTPRMHWQDRVIEEAEKATSLEALTHALTKVNQEEALKAGADVIYKGFDVDIIFFTTLWMYRNAVVIDDPAVFPGAPESEEDLPELLNTDAPKNYQELEKLYEIKFLREEVWPRMEPLKPPSPELIARAETLYEKRHNEETRSSKEMDADFEKLLSGVSKEDRERHYHLQKNRKLHSVSGGNRLSPDLKDHLPPSMQREMNV